MRYLVVGLGSVGGLVAARLAANGEEVLAVRRPGSTGGSGSTTLTVISAGGRLTVEVPALAGWDELTPGSGDVVLLCVKSQSTPDVLSAVGAHAPGVPIVCIQNGVENERSALRVLPWVAGGLLLCPVTQLEPGVVRSHSWPTSGVLDIGRYPEGPDVLATTVAADLASAGFSSRAVTDIMRWKYGKLLSNVLNAVDALCGWSSRGGELADLVVNEAKLCLQAAGIDAVPSDELRERSRGVADYTAVEGVEFSGSSTAQSLQRGAGSAEVDFLNGEICLLGRLHGIPTPANARVQDVCNKMAARGQAPGTVDEETLLRSLR